MNTEIGQQILQYKDLAYALTDSNMTIVETGGDLLKLAAGHQCIGLSLFEIAPELVGSEEQLRAVLQETESRFVVPTVNREGVHPNEICYVNLVHLPYRAADGRVIGLLHIVEEITAMAVIEQAVTQQRNQLYLLQERMAAQNVALEIANTELRQLDNLKTKFVSVAAHELRSPLAAITGYLDLLLDPSFGELTGSQHEFVAVLQRSTARLLSIVNNLLDVTRIETGRMELSLASCAVTTLIESVSAEIMPQLGAKRHELEIKLADKLPPLLCDEMRATQILFNLISNAVKYTPDHGRILVEVRLADEEGFLLFAVTDNGIGVPIADQPRLFETFYRAGNAYRTGASGAGLGLNITRSLVDLHGGQIWFDSVPDQGTTFYFTLPIDDYFTDEPALG